MKIIFVNFAILAGYPGAQGQGLSRDDFGGTVLLNVALSCIVLLAFRSWCCCTRLSICWHYGIDYGEFLFQTVVFVFFSPFIETFVIPDLKEEVAILFNLGIGSVLVYGRREMRFMRLLVLVCV